MNAKLPALALLALTIATAAPAATTAGTPRFTGEALLAANVPWATVQQVAGKSFWPELPAFNTTIDEEEPQPLAAVSQVFDDIKGKTTITTRLYAYPSPEISLEFLQSAAIVPGSIDQDSPAVGDQHFYYVTSLTSGVHSTRLYFVHKQIGVEIQVDGALWSRSKIAALADPIDQRLGQLLAGTLKAPPIPAAQLAHLPTRGLPGPVLGTAIVPAEAWANMSHNGSTSAIRSKLVATGNATFPFRRYLRQGSRTDVVEVALLTFPTAAAALAWNQPFSAGVKAHPPGRARRRRDRQPFRVPVRARQLRAAVRLGPLRRRRVLLRAVRRRRVTGLRGRGADARLGLVLAAALERNSVAGRDGRPGQREAVDSRALREDRRHGVAR